MISMISASEIFFSHQPNAERLYAIIKTFSVGGSQQCELKYWNLKSIHRWSDIDHEKEISKIESPAILISSFSSLHLENSNLKMLNDRQRLTAADSESWFERWTLKFFWCETRNETRQNRVELTLLCSSTFVGFFVSLNQQTRNSEYGICSQENEK